MYKGYLIDLDGTAYLGNEVIKETIQFTDALKEKGIPFLFVTNNSTKTETDVVNKLVSMGYNVDESNILTTAHATAMYVKKYHANEPAFVIGEGGIISALRDIDTPFVDNEHDAKLVVVGLDSTVDYAKFSTAALAIRNGAEFISTNPDIAIPDSRGMLPGNGAQTKFLEETTQVKATIIGKPEKHIMQAALDELQLTNREVAMIGDNYDTDIMSGVNLDIDTIFVNTGLTRKEDLPNYEVQPTHVCDTLLDFIPKI